MTELAKMIAGKLAEPAFDRIKTAWSDPSAPRWLKVVKVRPTGVDRWVVRLSSGREISLTDEEWRSAVFDAEDDPARQVELIGGGR